MIETQIIGHLAHDNKLFDVQCTECNMMYDGMTLPSRNACPKCGNSLGSIYTKKGRAMAISEGTIYPTMTETEKDQDAENVAKRKNAMPITYRFVLFSFANLETGILQEPPVLQYLATGREISKGDKIQLLGRKEVAGQAGAKTINQDATFPGVTSTPATQVDLNTGAAVANLNPPLSGTDIDTAAIIANIDESSRHSQDIEIHVQQQRINSFCECKIRKPFPRMQHFFDLEINVAQDNRTLALTFFPVEISLHGEKFSILKKGCDHKIRRKRNLLDQISFFFKKE